MIKDIGKMDFKAISGKVITADQKFLFTSSYDEELKQRNYQDKTLVKEYGRISNVFIEKLCIYNFYHGVLTPIGTLQSHPPNQVIPK